MSNAITMKTRREDLVERLRVLLSRVEAGEINAVLALAIPNDGSEMVVVEGKGTGEFKVAEIVFQVELFKHRLIASC